MTRVVDLGCGIGADALALADAGLGVVAVERDPVTAVLAAANLGGPVEVADAVDAWPALAASDPDAGVFADPARRTGAGRTWRLEDLSPPWDFALGLLGAGRTAALKLGPGVPHRVLPPTRTPSGSATPAPSWSARCGRGRPRCRDAAPPSSTAPNWSPPGRRPPTWRRRRPSSTSRTARWSAPG
ncbi:hypothetical protein [Propioniciclava coleopterorum]|uniref:hypothetical protein n=1 Tax=Propioniciclava coleopterorum TaxID=2714937 RepID=UPI001FE996E9|nr:hypothetical protein [Propioniciclava coleopterorum]